MTDKQKQPVSDQLPFDVRMALVRASQVKDPMHRLVAIEAAQALLRARFPHLVVKG